METNSTNPRELQSKIALVTGGTKGIGKAIANKLSLEGAKVIVTARSQPQDLNPAHYFIASDFSEKESVTNLGKQCLEKFGRMAAPEEIAELVNFLISSKASYLTGAQYNIDGGVIPVV